MTERREVGGCTCLEWLNRHRPKHLAVFGLSLQEVRTLKINIPKTYGAPSWSWASLDTSVEILFDY